jgi:predicted AlkP superfamily phosphohydrolase/phosphomutase
MFPRWIPFSAGGRVCLAAALALALGLPLGCGTKTRPPVVVIGLDGADFDLIVPWMEQGHLPNLKAFLDEAALGPLQVVYPILSPVCWTSATTGVNPGKHGIFDFQKPAPDGKGEIIETATNRRALPIWLLLSDAGFRVGVMNVPMTYPPDPVRGKMISGFPFPEGDINITYPPELKAELHDYPLDRLGVTQEGRSLDEMYSDFLERQAVRGRVAMEWVSSGDYDFLWLVFTATDKVQHFFWEDMDPNHPRHDPERAKTFGNAILDLWKKQDAIMGELLAALPPDATVLLMSDHGFDAIYRQVNMETWIGKTDVPAWLKTHSIPPTMITNGIVHYILSGPLAGGADREEFIDTFVALAKELKDPDTGACPFESVFRREDIYSGRMLEKAPDIVIQEIPKYFVTKGPPDSAGVPVFQDLWSTGFSAHHRPHGVLAVRGPDIRTSTSGSLRERLAGGGDFQDANILDVAPTLLALMQQTVPDAMDGRVLTETITPEFLAAHPVDIREVEGFLLDRLPPSELSPEDLEKFRALPYLQ